MFNLDVAQKVNKLQTNLEIQNKQGQIDILTKDRALQNLELDRQKFARNTLAIGLVLLIAVAFVLYKLYRKVGRRTKQVRRSLEDLKATQAQLIQAEKMASLGSLTAGIGHEIQNPLNFVNNFSEVNTDLLAELKEGPFNKLEGEERTEALDLLNYLTQNMMKISHHGKRADAIIKGMLEHSRKNTGERVLTNVNSLAEENLDLSYNGLSPANKAYNITVDRAWMRILRIS